MDSESFRRAIRAQVFPITRGIALGPFASATREDALQEFGITHILNVGEVPGVLASGSGSLREVVWRPVVDLERIPDAVAQGCLDELHRLVSQPDSRVYVHCVAGWNRSPTIVWLYLLACGLASDEARRLIASRSLDAIPGHSRLVDEQLVQFVRLHGRISYLPLARPESLQPA